MYPYFSKQNEATNQIIKKDLDDAMENKIEQDDFRTYIIDALKEAIEEQDENSRYYEKLYNMLTDEKDKNVLRQVYLNELKYKKIFEEIYKMITGTDANIREDFEEIEIDNNITEELYNSIEEQLDDIEFYRMLMSAFADLPIRDMIYEVIVGKQRNAQQLSNLYNEYRMR